MADNKNTPKPKPSVKPTVPVAVTPEVEAEELTLAISEVEAEEVEAEVVEVAKPAYTESVKANKVPATTYAVVSNDNVDTVHVSKIVAHNKAQKKSLSVHHLQRRLVEWGFMDAFLDRDGYCGDPTISAIAQFQKSLGLEATGKADYETLSRLFEGDTNVRLAN